MDHSSGLLSKLGGSGPSLWPAFIDMTPGSPGLSVLGVSSGLIYSSGGMGRAREPLNDFPGVDFAADDSKPGFPRRVQKASHERGQRGVASDLKPSSAINRVLEYRRS